MGSSLCFIRSLYEMGKFHLPIVLAPLKGWDFIVFILVPLTPLYCSLGPIELKIKFKISHSPVDAVKIYNLPKTKEFSWLRPNINYLYCNQLYS